ncbi:hypothetical protein THIOM_001869 [Candidatus Thiomargarita nelsonii]|uniref:Uncharacterized protein n=1 Tax=Candidatus Thiomargarita nelsonii TaxID=1003181 RepID=A0A176S334_9GAMM|nr:hypothetical protein THIOM_001869 [Candidatus Thiomargarita nelsonii]
MVRGNHKGLPLRLAVFNYFGNEVSFISQLVVLNKKKHRSKSNSTNDLAVLRVLIVVVDH